MRAHEEFEKLVEEISILRLSMTQAYINRHREYGRISLLTIANYWVDSASTMQKSEWEAGARAFIHYLKIRTDKSASEARKFLEQQLYRYEDCACLRRRHFRKKGYKTPAMLLLAKWCVSEEFTAAHGTTHQPNLHGAIRGAFSRFRRTLAQWRSSPSQ